MTTTDKSQSTPELKDSDPFHVCILGPPGIGKSPLASLFRMQGLDPRRVRLPRDAKDEALCISEPDAMDLLAKEVPGTHWPTPKAPNNWFILGERWLFISVRGARQCLRFKEDEKDGDGSILRTPKRVEIYAPRFLEILNNRDGCQAKIALFPHNIVVLLLNPSAEPFAKMKGTPNAELEQAIFYAVAKRTELQRKPVDLPDTQKRIRKLTEELVAWTEIKKLVGPSCIEYKSWKHFEFRYHQPGGVTEDAKRELLMARDTVLNGLHEAKTKGSIAASRLLAPEFIRSSEEILAMNEII